MSDSVTIAFTTPEGARIEVPAKLGESVMEAAIQNNVDGIEAECGGACMCATCHVYAGPAAVAVLPPRSEDEEDLLESAAAEVRDESRLSCQLTVTAELAGADFGLPDRQV